MGLDEELAVAAAAIIVVGVAGAVIEPVEVDIQAEAGAMEAARGE